MDYYLEQVENRQNKNFREKLIQLGKIKRKIIIKKQNDYEESESITWIYPSKDKLDSLPLNSTLITISFKLAKAYISKDDSEIYSTEKGKLLENPITRDKLTGFPMVRSTSWKGHLRFAAEKVNEKEFKNKGEIIKRLFGDSDIINDNMKGNLYFYPSIFQAQAQEDILTPINRKNRKGANLVNIEVMPQGSKACFYLLYFPYLLNNKEINEELKFVGKALKLMFYTYGFSAKKSSGFGIIQTLSEKDLNVYPNKFKNILSVLYEPDKGGVKKHE